MQHKQPKTKLFFALVFVSFFPACSSDGSDMLSDIFLGDFSNQWTVEKGKPKGPFTINPTVTDSAKAIGTFIGDDQNEFISSFGIKGSFVSTQVELRYLNNADVQGGDNGPYAGTVYKGIYDKNAKPSFKLRLVNQTNGTDSLVLVHG